MLSPRRMNGSAFHSRRPRCSRSAGLSTCGAIPRRSRRSGAPRTQRGRRAIFPSGSRSPRSRPSRSSIRATARGAPSKRCAARSTRSATGSRPGVAGTAAPQRRGARAPGCGRARRGSRGRAHAPRLRGALRDRGASRADARRLRPARSSLWSRTSTTARPTTDLATRIEVLVLHAVARHAQLDHDGAAASLERALELAGADRFPRVFLQAGSPLRDLLTRQVRQGTRHRGLVEELRVTLDRRAGALAGSARRHRCSSRSASAS